MLKVTDLRAGYGRTNVLDRISLEVGEGEAVSVLGANGAGKTTLLRAITGLLNVRSGEVVFEGKSIRGKTPEEIVRRGMVLTPEGRRLFGKMTVLENLILGAYSRPPGTEVEESLDYIFERFPILFEKRKHQARDLSGGQQQLLAIARGCMARPKLLLLDEPTMGLAPVLIESIESLVNSLKAELKMSLLLVEQNLGTAMNVTRRAYVMHHGSLLIQGDWEHLGNAEIVRDVYLRGGQVHSDAEDADSEHKKENTL